MIDAATIVNEFEECPVLRRYCRERSGHPSRDVQYSGGVSVYHFEKVQNIQGFMWEEANDADFIGLGQKGYKPCRSDRKGNEPYRSDQKDYEHAMPDRKSYESPKSD
ncbi:hypothetical protein ACFE04_030758 [Oxalis oulophora]